MSLCLRNVVYVCNNTVIIIAVRCVSNNDTQNFVNVATTNERLWLFTTGDWHPQHSNIPQSRYDSQTRERCINTLRKCTDNIFKHRYDLAVFNYRRENNMNKHMLDISYTFHIYIYAIAAKTAQILEWDGRLLCNSKQPLIARPGTTLKNMVFNEFIEILSNEYNEHVSTSPGRWLKNYQNTNTL